MEKLKNYLSKGKEYVREWLVTVWLAWVLLSGATSCGKATPYDVIKQKQKVEQLKRQRDVFIQERENLAKEYNEKDAYPRTEANTYSIEIVKADLLEKMQYIEEKIKEIRSDITESEMQVAEKSAECAVGIKTGPIDVNKYDFLKDD